MIRKTPLDTYKEKGVEMFKEYRSQKKICQHIASRYQQGWLPLGIVMFKPAINKYDKGRNDVADAIVDIIESEGEIKFKDCHFIDDDICNALKEITSSVPITIDHMISEHGAYHLMIDRNAFLLSGYHEPRAVQWYIRR